MHSDPTGMFLIDWDLFSNQEAGKNFALWLQEIIESFPTKEEHYNRNNSNPDFPDEYDARYFEEWDDSVSADCHQFTSPDKSNVKYVSPDGKYEVIYDSSGREVTDPRDVGTYNFISSLVDPIGHFIVDVIPWIRYGNSPDDSTTPQERWDAFWPG